MKYCNLISIYRPLSSTNPNLPLTRSTSVHTNNCTVWYTRLCSWGARLCIILNNFIANKNVNCFWLQKINFNRKPFQSNLVVDIDFILKKTRTLSHNKNFSPKIKTNYKQQTTRQTKDLRLGEYFFSLEFMTRKCDFDCLEISSQFKLPNVPGNSISPWFTSHSVNDNSFCIFSGIWLPWFEASKWKSGKVF